MVLPRSLVDPHVRTVEGESVGMLGTVAFNKSGVGEGVSELLPLSRKSVML